ncbi:MAG: hypothetical protein ACU4EQ_10570 [Candidatus Nitrosoglobus sp.]|jgi:hypothetical protein
MKKSFIAFAAGTFFAIAGVAVAADKPVMLSANQMDNVTAGGVANATAAANALGAFMAATTTNTSTSTAATLIIPTEGGQITGVFSLATASSSAAAQ